MEALHACRCGLDVHKDTVVACLLRLEGGQRRKELRTFGTMTADLLALADWLHAAGCTQVAMESTGVYWKPIYNSLEGQFTLLVVNAAHIKAVPGRKTDLRDAEWIADLLQHGRLRASFIPDRPQRELRDLTRTRTSLIDERSAVVNRLQKVLEDANIKLAGVASDVMGVSGRAILAALLAGPTDPATLAELAKGRLRAKRAALAQALSGRVSGHHRLLLTTHLAHADFLDEEIARLSAEIAERLRPLEDELARLDSIPGVDRRAALPQRRPPRLVGGDVPRQPRQRRQSEGRQDAPGQQVAAPGADRGGPWGGAHQAGRADGAGRPVPAAGRAPREEESGGRRRTPHPDDRLPPAPAAGGLSGTGASRPG